MLSPYGRRLRKDARAPFLLQDSRQRQRSLSEHIAHANFRTASFRGFCVAGTPNSEHARRHFILYSVPTCARSARIAARKKLHT